MQICPKPPTVEIKLEVLSPPPRPKAVEKEEKDKETKFVVKIKEDVKESVEIQSDDPRPCTVETKLLVIPKPVTVDVIDDANSVGSIKVLIFEVNPTTVLYS